MSRAGVRNRPGWTRLTPPGSRTNHGHWRHVSGWEIRHCGHPTALYPYYAVDPKHPERATVTFNGKGFWTLLLAMEAVEGIVAGELRVTNQKCGPATRRLTKLFLGSEACR